MVVAVLDRTPAIGDDATAWRFLRSALTPATPTAPDGHFDEWFARRCGANAFEVDRVPLTALPGWHFDDGTGDLRHESGRFFTVAGLLARTDPGWRAEWRQPIILQPEIGTLGILAKEFDGVLHFLMQAKMEPGNATIVQLSPTVQATRSNYTGVHRGAAIKYLEFFAPGRHRVLVDSLQSEQGSWFLHKRNRNIVVETSDDVAVDDDFCWLTLGQILGLLRRENVVNMDSRTVVSCIPLPPEAPAGEGFAASLRRSMSREAEPLHPDGQVLSWLTGMRAQHELIQQRIPLDAVLGGEWFRDDERIARRDGRFFSVIGVDVRASNREVRSWGQPLLAPARPGLVGLLVKRHRGVAHVLVQARVEAGAAVVAELGPSVHCQPDNYRDAEPGTRPAFLDWLLAVPAGRLHYDAVQSEEGGRFYHAVNRYVVAEADEAVPDEAPDGYLWVTLRQLTMLMPHGNYLNVELRSALVCVHSLWCAGSDDDES
ncbi:NDP-hexose 2,3-dehydratase family protein [Actinoplanes sp. NPDC051343]|jgi:oxidase EvaA|uniref:NDP-hexose 2,3-dehydratase family protein n=1 Tax=Actinoplanes sp. NPDC051343 TaxID=3363906 RepID=UPI00379B2CCA